VHGIDAEGKVIVRRQMKRSYVLVFIPKLSSCLVGIEACATSHHWFARTQGARAYRALDAAGLKGLTPFE